MEANAKGGEISLTAAQMDEIERLLPVGFAHGPRYGKAMSKGPESYC